MARLETFPAAERDAFASACRRHGFIAADFCVCDCADDGILGTRLVSVRRTKVDASMLYAADVRESWPAGFELDHCQLLSSTSSFFRVAAAFAIREGVRPAHRRTNPSG